MGNQEARTLYDRIGGDPAIKDLLTAFYQRVFADPELRPFFADTPLEKLQNMQREFFAAALDGPIRYTGRPIAEVHSGLGIRPRHLQRFLEHLLATLENEGVDEEDRYEIYTRIATWSDSITGSSTVDG